MNSEGSPNDPWDSTVHYPDLDMSDGLAEALKRRASGLGLALDGLVEGFGRAVLVTDRGTVSISIAAQERGFGIAIYESGVEWSSGATEDLGKALRAATAWQDGLPLDDYVSEFPFMNAGRLAHAFVAGRLAEAQWQGLLDSEYHTGGQRLLVSLAPFGELRRFYPEISYGELRFTMPPPRQDDRVFRVSRDGPGFHVEEPCPERREYNLDTLDEVARRIVDFFSE